MCTFHALTTSFIITLQTQLLKSLLDDANASKEQLKKETRFVKHSYGWSLHDVYLQFTCFLSLAIHYASHVLNALTTIDNEISRLIIFCFYAFAACMKSAMFEAGQIYY